MPWLLVLMLATRALLAGAFPSPWAVLALTAAPQGGGQTTLQRPNVVHHDGVLWVSYVSGEGHPSVLRWDLAAGTGQATALTATAIVDTHDNPALLRTSGGGLLAVWANHNDDVFRAISGDGVEWGAPANVTSQVGSYSGAEGYTYPKLWEDGDGVHLWIRKGGAFSMGTAHVESLSTDGGLSWGTGAAFFEGPYLTFARAGGRVDVMVRPNSSEDGVVAHGYLEGGTWHRSDGTPISAPFGPGDLTQVASHDGTHRTIGLDVVPGPEVGLVRYRKSDGGDRTYRHARWDGSSWVVSEIAPADTDDILLTGLSLSPGTAWLVRVDGTADVWRYRTLDGGATWAGSRVTASGVDEVQPFVTGVPAMPAMWFSGSFAAADDFSLGISALARA